MLVRRACGDRTSTTLPAADVRSRPSCLSAYVMSENARGEYRGSMGRGYESRGSAQNLRPGHSLAGSLQPEMAVGVASFLNSRAALGTVGGILQIRRWSRARLVHGSVHELAPPGAQGATMQPMVRCAACGFYS